MNSGPFTADKIEYGPVIPTYHGLGNMDFREEQLFAISSETFSYEEYEHSFSNSGKEAIGFKNLAERPREAFSVDDE
ncbi:MAG: hypothetical protein LBI56_03110 [Puniceicoccales bacterium]|jgi:hypothetical protein|nr:hypothetical protein [Puniceicoccales bacterium]